MPPPIIAIPRSAAGARGVDRRRAPEPLFEGIGAALVAARDERRAGGGDRRERGDRVMAARDMRRIRARTDHDEIVPGDLPAIDAVPLGDELFLGLRIGHQDQIGVAMRRRRQRLARPWARTRTEMPVSLVNSGRMCASRPEFSTEVVEASTIASSARLASPANMAEPIRIAAASFPLTTTVPPWRRRQRSWH
jgi:hypothetical protein